MTCCRATKSRSRIPAGASSLMAQSSGAGPEVGQALMEVQRKALDVERRGKDGGDAALPIEQEDRCGVIHRVVTAWQLHARGGNTEFRAQPLDLLGIAGQADELRIEGMH